MPERRREVLAYPQPIRNVDPSVLDALELLRANVGLLTSIAYVPLLLSETGVGTTAVAGGTAIVQANATLDLEDARINSVRLEAYGASSGAGDSIRVKQGSTVICTATLGAAGVARLVGAWTKFAPDGGDLSYSLEVVGDGVRTQTLHRVVLQSRTV